MPPYTADVPAKKQSKWSSEEDVLIIELRGSGMKWEDISKRLPGRSAISCRLHYQNYLERRSEWDEERKNKLARLYERLKPEIWAKVAEEMQVPWRAAEAMHWQLGETEMARRAGVTPFSLTASTIDTSSSPVYHHRRSSPEAPSQPLRHQNQSKNQNQSQPQSQSQKHSQKQDRNRQQSYIEQQHYLRQISGYDRAGFLINSSGAGGSASSGDSLSPHYGRSGHPATPSLPPPAPPTHGDRFSARPGNAEQGLGGGYRREGPLTRLGAGTDPRASLRPGIGSSDPANSMCQYQQPLQSYQPGGPGLPPIHLGSSGPLHFQQHGRMTAGSGGGESNTLPSISEITTGVSPFSTTAYSQGEHTSNVPPRQDDSPIPGRSSGLPPSDSRRPTLPSLSYGGSGALPSVSLERGGPEPLSGGSGKRQASPSIDTRDSRRRYLLRSPRHDSSSGPS